MKQNTIFILAASLLVVILLLIVTLPRSGSYGLVGLRTEVVTECTDTGCVPHWNAVVREIDPKTHDLTIDVVGGSIVCHGHWTIKLKDGRIFDRAKFTSGNR